MSFRHNKTQLLANYFPEYCAVRQDKYSLGSMFFNCFANKFFLDRQIIKDYAKDLLPLARLSERPQHGYTASTSFIVDTSTSCEVTGTVGNSVVSGTCSVYLNMADVLEDLAFGYPDVCLQGSTTSKTIDYTIEVTGQDTEYGINSELEYDVPNILEIYVSGFPHWSSTIPQGCRHCVSIEGLTKEYPYENITEQIFIRGDGIFQSRNRWLYIESVTIYGLDGVTVIIRSPGVKFPYRRGNDDYYVPEMRGAVDKYVTCENSPSGIFTIYYPYVYPRVEAVNEPVHVFQTMVSSGEVCIPNDYAISPRGHQMAVLSGTKVFIYDMREELPSTVKDIVKHETCPYHLSFEIHTETQIAIKLHNKFLNNPFDYNLALIVQDPMGYRWLLDGVGNRYVDEGQYLTAASYPKRFLYSARCFGPHIFYIKYYDTETYSHRSQAYLYNFEQKLPVFSFDVPDAAGIAWVRDNVMVTTTSSGIATVWNLVNFMAYYYSDLALQADRTTSRRNYITFFNIQPSCSIWEGTTECYTLDACCTGSYAKFGNLLVAGEL